MDSLPPIETLPPNLARIAGIVGVEAALRIAAVDGGRYCAFPVVEWVDEGHWLAEMIGLKAARKLSFAVVGDGVQPVSLFIERADGSKRRGDSIQPLPLMLELIASMVGTEAALLIATKRGGERISFPTTDRLNADHWLVELVGFPAALRLCREFGGTHENDVPRGPTSERIARRHPGCHPLDEFLMAGLSLSQSASKAGFDRSTARRRRVYLRAKGALP